MKLGIELAERTVSRLMPKRRIPPSQTWRTFLANHVRDLVAVDFFTVPTAQLRVLFVFVVLAHHRGLVLHFNVTEHPTAAWTAQQIVDTFPDDSAPSYLLRDRDSIYGHAFRHRVKGMGLREVLTAPSSPWQNPFAERLIGSIRRECLDHVLVLSERHLRRILARYFSYYHRARTHLALDKDAPDVRPVERPEAGRVARFPKSVASIIATSGKRPDLAPGQCASPARHARHRQAVLRSSRSPTSFLWAGWQAPGSRGPTTLGWLNTTSDRSSDESSRTESDAVVARDRV
jgi:putative transposase